MKKTKDVFDEAAQLAFIGMVGRNDLAVTLGDFLDAFESAEEKP